MSYDSAADKPPYWSILTKSFGATSQAYQLKGPPGKKGLVKDILVSVSTTLVGTTTVPEVNVGTALSDSGAIVAEYARFRLGTTATAGYDTTSGAALRARSLATTITSTGKPTLTDYTAHILLETDYIPKDTAFFISLVKGVGSAAGAGDVYVFIDWI
jgi:hypothetical protein